VIELEGAPIGRLYVHRGEREIRIVDITLVPGQLGKGLGTRLLQGLQEEAASTRKTLTIHVEKFNPALRLYQWLGFEVVEERGAYLFLRWQGQGGLRMKDEERGR
jgi:ribosomal protein S18 acetylase RimI-like enzyme